jgi:hypothetical protein
MARQSAELPSLRRAAVDRTLPRRPSVLLVREWEQQLSGSGCCGRLEGDVLSQGGEHLFAERRRIMERMGPVYRAIRERFGDTVSVMVVDPRNQIVLLPRLLRDFVRYRVGWRDALHTLRGLSTIAVIVNGRLFARGAWPETESLLAQLERLMGGDEARHATR